MNNKIIAGSALALLLTSVVFAGEGTAPFTISIQVDTTIAIPALCETVNSTNSGKLDFQPSLRGIQDSESVAIDTCATGAIGDWNITTLNNVPLNISFKVVGTVPKGITVAVGNTSPYVASDFVNLTDSFKLPLWAQDLDWNYGSTMQVWQRVGANTSALGGINITDTYIEVQSNYQV